MLRQYPQELGAQGQSRVAVHTQSVEIQALCQCLLVVAAAEVDGHEPRYGSQLAGQVLALLCLAPGCDEGFDSGRRTALGVVIETGMGQFQHEGPQWARRGRSEEHTSELQSLMRISSAVFC